MQGKKGRLPQLRNRRRDQVQVRHSTESHVVQWLGSGALTAVAGVRFPAWEILFFFFFLHEVSVFVGFFFCLFFPLHLILASSMKPFYTHVLSYTFIYWQVAQRMSQEIKRRREVLLQSQRMKKMKSSHRLLPLLLKSCNSQTRFSAGHRNSELFNHLRYIASFK